MPVLKPKSSVISSRDLGNLKKSDATKCPVVHSTLHEYYTVRQKVVRPTIPKAKQISIRALHLALERCQQFVAERRHADIDSVEEAEPITDAKWTQFIEVYQIFIKDKLQIDRKALSLMNKCKETLKSVRLKAPQYHMEGVRNVWVLKPGAKSRGRGIQCTDNFNEILGSVSPHTCTIIAQKYIERPMLIHSVKFDIRQWFLVTSWNPLTMWFYNACYLRFCCKKYTLDDFHPSIHLSNNSIQKNYTPDPDRAKELPEDNMWTHREFTEYLKKIGRENVFKDKIVPGMKKAIISTLRCTQELVEPREGTFELFGADFMLTEDFSPWLIEINSSPSMARTTKATNALVNCVLEDTVKVILDRKTDSSCDTGDFELVFQQPFVSEPPKSSESTLAVIGKQLLPSK